MTVWFHKGILLNKQKYPNYTSNFKTRYNETPYVVKSVKAGL